MAACERSEPRISERAHCPAGSLWAKRTTFIRANHPPHARRASSARSARELKIFTFEYTKYLHFPHCDFKVTNRKTKTCLLLFTFVYFCLIFSVYLPRLSCCPSSVTDFSQVKHFWLGPLFIGAKPTKTRKKDLRRYSPKHSVVFIPFSGHFSNSHWWPK